MARHALSLALAVAFGWCPGEAAGQADISGIWKTVVQFLDPATGFDGFVDITQSGSSVTICFDLSTGTMCIPATIGPSGDISGYNTEPTLSILGQLRGNYIDAAVFLECLGSCPIFRFLVTRCQCRDGNETDGDGCDARCQVEPCFTCSGDPSSCTPRPDGSTCDDGSPCTAGETCTGGVCGGGSPVPPPCVDLSGHWLIELHSDDFPDLDPPPFPSTIEQNGSSLLFGSLYLTAAMLGTIDPLTGGFDAEARSTFGLCAFYSDTLTGVASLDGKSWTGTYTEQVSVMDCDFAFPFQITATRCGGGTLDPGEECDDGNHTDGDGCSALCLIEPVKVCNPTPRTGCRQAPNGVLVIRKGAQADGNSLLWKWTQGDATTTADLGNPGSGTTFYTFCVYDTAANQPSLAMQMIVPPGTNGSWAAREDGVRYREPSGAADGVTKLQLWTGASGAARISLKGHGAALPVPSPASADSLLAVDPTIVAQLVNTDGTCWESVYPGSQTRARVSLLKARP